MKKKNAHRLLIEVLAALHHQHDASKRYQLRLIGESLLSEWKDMKVKKTEKRIGDNRSPAQFPPVAVAQ